jgi:hypothetical protein
VDVRDPNPRLLFPLSFRHSFFGPNSDRVISFEKRPEAEPMRATVFVSGILSTAVQTFDGGGGQRLDQEPADVPSASLDASACSAFP